MATTQSAAEQANLLLSQLTIEEKVSMLTGKNFWETQEIERLSIPSLKVTDGPNGARGQEFYGGVRAACFPASVCLAATWDAEIVQKIGVALAEETLTKGAHVILGPTVCPHRHPLGGRNFESFSEDPLLAGKLSASYIRGVQSKQVGATIKHFAVNEQESHRFSINANVSERALREIYLKPFEIAIKESDPWCVMTSYNVVNGIHSDMNSYLLDEILRKQWAYKGLVMSDWGGTNSLVESAKAGLALEMPGPPKHRQLDAVKAALSDGSLSVETIDSRVREVIELLQRSGKFEKPETPAEQAIINPEHSKLIRNVGATGMVLLKNDDSTLPIQKQNLKRVAVLGLAKEALIHGGGSASLNAHYKISPYDALRAELPENVEVVYAKGAHTYRVLPHMTSGLTNLDGKPGLTAKGYLNDAQEPSLVTDLDTSYFLDLRVFKQRVVIEGTFTPPEIGNHCLQLCGIGRTIVSIEDQVVMETTGELVDLMAFLFGGVIQAECRFDFKETRPYKLRIETYPPAPGAVPISALDCIPGVTLGFMTAKEHDQDLTTEAAELAKSADVALVFVGNTPSWETEGRDADNMDLPVGGSQDRLIEAVAAANPNTVVINSTGVPVTMPWISKVPAILQTWFPGQEAGNAISDVLFGKVNPAGRLPVTFPKSLEDTPAYGNFPGNLETDEVNYAEDIFMGYRHYDNHAEGVLFPFGYGLSYTSFEWQKSALTLSSTTDLQPGSQISVSVTVQNTGKLTGSELIQVYVAPTNLVKPLTVKTPQKRLVSWAKVANLAAGESETTQAHFLVSDFADFDEEKGKWVVGAGEYDVIVARNASADAKEASHSFKVSNDLSWDP